MQFNVLFISFLYLVSIPKSKTGYALPMWELNMKNIVRFLKDKSGATAIEYGLIAALIAVAVISGVTALGTNANATFNKVSGEISKGAT